jgi:hypothetical protein
MSGDDAITFNLRRYSPKILSKMEAKFMRKIVPSGYAVPKKEIQRLTEELRQARAGELANASEKDRARIEKEISLEAQKKITNLGRLKGYVLHLAV